MYPGYEVRLKFYWTTTWTTPSPPALLFRKWENQSSNRLSHSTHITHHTQSHTLYTLTHHTWHPLYNQVRWAWPSHHTDFRSTCLQPRPIFSTHHPHSDPLQTNQHTNCHWACSKRGRVWRWYFMADKRNHTISLTPGGRVALFASPAIRCCQPLPNTSPKNRSGSHFRSVPSSIYITMHNF